MQTLKNYKHYMEVLAEQLTEPGSVIELPAHGSCFVCGDKNPKGMGLHWFAKRGAVPEIPGKKKVSLPTVLIYSDFVFTLAEQGPPNHAHGGASSAVIDEAMGCAVWISGLEVLLAKMTLNYRCPVPLGTAIRVEAWVTSSVDKKTFTAGHILLANGKVAVEANGLYIYTPKMFESVLPPDLIISAEEKGDIDPNRTGYSQIIWVRSVLFFRYL